MTDLHYDRRVIAYHGTDKATARRVFDGASFLASENDYDWLGHGIYFWEDGPDRAWSWARKRHGHKAAVVGALIQLGACYDLMDTRYTRDLAAGAKAFHERNRKAGLPLPENQGLRRPLDCAVINWWLGTLAHEVGLAFQTVRRGFEEGAPVYPGMGITLESHVQIAVRDPACILGVFRPRTNDPPGPRAKAGRAS